VSNAGLTTYFYQYQVGMKNSDCLNLNNFYWKVRWN